MATGRVNLLKSKARSSCWSFQQTVDPVGHLQEKKIIRKIMA